MFRFVILAVLAGGIVVAPVASAKDAATPKAVIEAYVDYLNSGDASALEAISAEGIEVAGEAPGREAFVSRSGVQYENRVSEYAEWHFAIDRIFTDGDDVAARVVLSVSLKNGKALDVEGIIMATVKDGQMVWLATALDAEDALNLLMLNG